LYDLTEMVEEDPDLTQPKAFQNILLSAQTSEGLFAIPVNFYASAFCANSETYPKFENKRMTWKEFFDNSATLSLPYRAWSDSDFGIFRNRFLDRSKELIDRENRTQNLNSSEMIALLKDSAAWRDAGLCSEIRDVNTLVTPGCYSGIAAYWQNIAKVLCDLPNRTIEYYPQKNIVMAPLISDSENPADTDVAFGDLYGVNANSPNKDKAVQFLQYLLSPEMQKMLASSSDPEMPGNYSDGLAINREAFRQQVEDDLKAIQQETPEEKVYDEKEKYISEAEDRLNQIDKVIIEQAYYEELIYETAREYFMDKITAEEAAQRMADKVGLYLKEQG